MQATFEPAFFESDLRTQLNGFLDEHRFIIEHCLDDLTEEEARRRLVASQTTLLGLVKHATFVEQVWFDETVTGRSRHDIGMDLDIAASFALGDGDTIASVLARYRAVCETSRRNAATLTLNDVTTGNRRGPLPMRWVMLHVLRELAHHCGHCDILREQVLSQRSR